MLTNACIKITKKTLGTYTYTYTHTHVRGRHRHKPEASGVSRFIVLDTNDPTHTHMYTPHTHSVHTQSNTYIHALQTKHNIGVPGPCIQWFWVPMTPHIYICTHHTHTHSSTHIHARQTKHNIGVPGARVQWFWRPRSRIPGRGDRGY